MPTDFDERDFPLVRMHVHGESSDAEVAERLAFAERVLGRRRTVAMIFDTSGSRGLTAAQRKMWADWLTEHDALVREYLSACAIVVTSTFGRAVFTGVFWWWAPPMPYAFFATVGEAEAWVSERLGQARTV